MLFEVAKKIIPPQLKVMIKPYFRYVFPNLKTAHIIPSYRCNYACSYCLQHGDEYRKRFSIAAVERERESILVLNGLLH